MIIARLQIVKQKDCEQKMFYIIKRNSSLSITCIVFDSVI